MFQAEGHSRQASIPRHPKPRWHKAGGRKLFRVASSNPPVTTIGSLFQLGQYMVQPLPVSSKHSSFHIASKFQLASSPQPPKPRVFVMQLDSSARRAIIAVPGGGPEALLDLSILRCLGAHNAHNAGTAALLALSLGLGLTEEDVQRALPTLQPPPHRMEIGELGLHGCKEWTYCEEPLVDWCSFPARIDGRGNSGSTAYNATSTST
jgi:hypothetical protein